jgi:hypothetical protein
MGSGGMTLYSYMTGLDDSGFCHRVTERLNRGWQLYGAPTLTYDTEKKQVICGQVMTKEVDGDYSPDIDLVKL